MPGPKAAPPGCWDPRPGAGAPQRPPRSVCGLHTGAVPAPSPRAPGRAPGARRCSAPGGDAWVVGGLTRARAAPRVDRPDPDLGRAPEPGSGRPGLSQPGQERIPPGPPPGAGAAALASPRGARARARLFPVPPAHGGARPARGRAAGGRLPSPSRFSRRIPGPCCRRLGAARSAARPRRPFTGSRGSCAPLGPGPQRPVPRRRPTGRAGRPRRTVPPPGRGRRSGSPAAWAPSRCVTAWPLARSRRGPPSRPAVLLGPGGRGGAVGAGPGGPAPAGGGHGTLAGPLRGCRPGKTVTWRQRLARGHGPPRERCAAWAVLGQAAAAGGAGGPGASPACRGDASCRRAEGGFMRLVVPVTAPWRGTAGCHPRKVEVDAASGAWGLASIP